MHSQLIVIEVSNLLNVSLKKYIYNFLTEKKNTFPWVQRAFDNMKRDVISFNYHPLPVEIRKNIAEMSGAFLLNFHSIDNAVYVSKVWFHNASVWAAYHSVGRVIILRS